MLGMHSPSQSVPLGGRAGVCTGAAWLSCRSSAPLERLTLRRPGSPGISPVHPGPEATVRLQVKETRFVCSSHPALAGCWAVQHKMPIVEQEIVFWRVRGPLAEIWVSLVLWEEVFLVWGSWIFGPGLHFWCFLFLGVPVQLLLRPGFGMTVSTHCVPFLSHWAENCHACASVGWHSTLLALTALGNCEGRGE